MRFSLEGAPGKTDMCMSILATGTPEGRCSLRYDDITGGTFVAGARKALPQWGDVDVAAVSASVCASLAGPTATAAVTGG